MTTPPARTPQRSTALSRAQIVGAAIELLDASGESALTVRALTTHLATGRGAIYHYLAGKDELLAAATEAIVDAALAKTAPRIGNTDEVPDAGPAQALRTVAIELFEALTEHPWIGVQLSREPMQPAVLHIWTTLGRLLDRMGVTADARFNAGATLMNYLLGAAAQHAATAQNTSTVAERRAYLEALASELTRLDPDAATRETAAALVQHDDREQFLAGIDLILAGIAAAR